MQTSQPRRAGTMEVDWTSRFAVEGRSEVTERELLALQVVLEAWMPLGAASGIRVLPHLDTLGGIEVWFDESEADPKRHLLPGGEWAILPSYVYTVTKIRIAHLVAPQVPLYAAYGAQGVPEQVEWLPSFAEAQRDANRISRAQIGRAVGFRPKALFHRRSLLDGRVQQRDEWAGTAAGVEALNRWVEPGVREGNLEAWERRGRNALAASAIVQDWFRPSGGSLSPMDREGGDYWLMQFQYAGPFHAWIDETIERDAHGRLSIERLEPLDHLDAPPRLYRAATEGLRDRWSWTESLEAAQQIAASRGVGYMVWTAEPEEVYGVIDIVPDTESPVKAAFQEWIIKPRNVSLVE